MNQASSRLFFPLLVAVSLTACAFVGCGGGNGSGTGTGGAIASGGSGTGGKVGSGGSTASSGGSGTGGAPATGGASASGGGTATGGTLATGGAPATGGVGTGGVSGGGGRAGGAGGRGTAGATGGVASTGGSGGAGEDGGVRDGAATDAGTGGTGAGGATFAPCPTDGTPCKILPLGDSITLGTNYQGGYRIKLYAHAVTDKKNITFVGYDTANPPTAATLSALGSAGSAFVAKHEGHYAWTIQQVDDLVTGVSTGSQDGVNYAGKKVVADARPQIVLIHLGSNDVQVQPSGASDRLAKLIDHVVSDAPNALVVVASIIPLPAKASNVSALNQAIPGIVSARAAAGKHVIFVDQYAGFNGKTGLMDSVHPYEAGYEQMSVVWYAAIKPYLN